MKKSVVCLLSLLVVSSALAVGLLTSGFGRIVTASTTTARLDGFSAQSLTVHNTSTSEYVLVAVNVSTNQFNTLVTATSAVPVAASSSFTFNTQGRTSIHSLCYKTTNSTAVVYVSAY